jgi:hypothetical protein
MRVPATGGSPHPPMTRKEANPAHLTMYVQSVAQYVLRTRQCALVLCDTGTTHRSDTGTSDLVKGRAQARPLSWADAVQHGSSGVLTAPDKRGR